MHIQLEAPIATCTQEPSRKISPKDRPSYIITQHIFKTPGKSSVVMGPWILKCPANVSEKPWVYRILCWMVGGLAPGFPILYRTPRKHELSNNTPLNHIVRTRLAQQIGKAISPITVVIIADKGIRPPLNRGGRTWDLGFSFHQW